MDLTSTVDLNNPAYFPHDGIRNLLVTAEDLAGNVSAARSTLTIFVDTQGPQISNVQITQRPDLQPVRRKDGWRGPSRGRPRWSTA